MRAPEMLGRDVAETQDIDLSMRNDIEAVRARLFAEEPKTTEHSQPLRLILGVTGISIAAVAAVLVLWLWPSSLTVQNAVTGEALAEDDFVSSPEDRELLLAFSDGSEISLEPKSGVRVIELDVDGAQILVETGAAVVKVVHNDRSRWRVDVGPFKVRVVGTTFRVAWSPQGEHFRIDLRSGQVEVLGPMVQDGRIVESGQTFQVWVKEARTETARIVESDVDELPPVVPITDASVPEESRDDFESGVSRRRSRPTQEGTEQRWQSLVRERRFSEAIESAESVGFETVLAQSSVRDLLQLGDAARLGGKTERAIQVYRAIRQRFPRTSASSRAAFFLGRISFDRRGAYSEAATWFSTYLREQPSGPLAREASGRRFEALHRAGATSQAQELARRYLQSYPNGPHAATARRITVQDVEGHD